MKEETRICQNCKASFTIDASDFTFYEKIKVPAPTWCPECRLQRRFSFRNERALYKRPCDLCGKDIVTVYSPDKPFTVYCLDCFFSDRWDPFSYGIACDFSKPFFEQWGALQRRIPHPANLQKNNINSPWVNYEIDDKNCYLNVGGHFNEDCAYNQYALRSRDIFDNYWVFNSEFAYESVLCGKCYKTFYSTLCVECRDTYFSFDCKNCSHIFGCFGLRNKQYSIFNKQVSEAEFEGFLRTHLTSSFSEREQMRQKVKEFWRTQPHRALYIDRKSMACVGNNIQESKRCISCWNVEKIEDGKFLFLDVQLKDAYDVTSVWWGEMLYEYIAGSEQVFNVRFSNGVVDGSRDIEYSKFLVNAHDCFGCISLRNKNFCILNMPYSENKYRTLSERIRRHMTEMPYRDRSGKIYGYGEFFPPELSQFGYNETVAQEYFPLEESAAHKKGFLWSNYGSVSSHPFSDYIIPDDIHDVGDDILDKILKCEVSGKAYRLIPMELAFYQKFGLPIPRKSPFVRHRERLSFVADHRTLYARICKKCGKKIETVWNEEEAPMVYCEVCYQREMI